MPCLQQQHFECYALRHSPAGSVESGHGGMRLAPLGTAKVHHRSPSQGSSTLLRSSLTLRGGLPWTSRTHRYDATGCYSATSSWLASDPTTSPTAFRHPMASAAVNGELIDLLLCNPPATVPIATPSQLALSSRTAPDAEPTAAACTRVCMSLPAGFPET